MNPSPTPVYGATQIYRQAQRKIAETYYPALTKRYIGTCKNKTCKQPMTIDAVRAEGWYETNSEEGYHVSGFNGGRLFEFSCPHCQRGSALRYLKPVMGTVSTAHICDERCVYAKKPVCECSCGGENHGAGNLIHI